MMHRNHERDDAGGDERVVRALRARYAAPESPAYWDGLEARIMSRVRSESSEWWQAFGGWFGAGLVAAGLSMLVASAAVWQTRVAEARIAYEAVIDQPPAASAVAGVRRAVSEREATIRYLIQH